MSIVNIYSSPIKRILKTLPHKLLICIPKSNVSKPAGNFTTSNLSSIAIGAADLEGWYSADKSFIVLGSHNCNTTADLRLNVQGSIIVNASGNGGTFNYSARDLCTGNLTCPVFYIEQRADFVLNAPRFLLTAPRIWREVAP